jgi:nicotinamide mononucleotide transporter
MEVFNEIINGILNTGWLEGLGVLTGITYVILAARKQIACWSFAIISTSIYIFLCFTKQLYIESGLQVFYLIMGVYGWIKWNADEVNDLPIQRWLFKYHFINIFISALVTILLGYIMQTYTAQESPYLDAFTTIFSLAATFMVTQRVLGNWIYWIVIDAALAVLYSSRDLYLTGFQYAVFTVIAIFAFYKWLKYYREQHVNHSAKSM